MSNSHNTMFPSKSITRTSLHRVCLLSVSFAIRRKERFTSMFWRKPFISGDIWVPPCTEYVCVFPKSKKRVFPRGFNNRALIFGVWPDPPITVTLYQSFFLNSAVRCLPAALISVFDLILIDIKLDDDALKAVLGYMCNVCNYLTETPVVSGQGDWPWWRNCGLGSILSIPIQIS